MEENISLDSSESTSNYHQNLNEQQKSQKSVLIIIIIIVVLIVVGILVSLYFLLQPQTDTAKIRDVFIIFMALESILLGVTLVVLMVQLAKLINLLQHEVLPILESTNETISNIRGTAEFLGENITEPVIKINSYTAGLSKFLQAIGLTKTTKHNKKLTGKKLTKKAETKKAEARNEEAKTGEAKIEETEQMVQVRINKEMED